MFSGNWISKYHIHEFWACIVSEFTFCDMNIFNTVIALVLQKSISKWKSLFALQNNSIATDFQLWMGSSYRRTRATESTDDQLVQLEEGFHPSNFAEMFIRLEIVTGLQTIHTFLVVTKRSLFVTNTLPACQQKPSR